MPSLAGEGRGEEKEQGAEQAAEAKEKSNDEYQPPAKQARGEEGEGSLALHSTSRYSWA